MKLLNAFSSQMLETFPAFVRFTELKMVGEKLFSNTTGEIFDLQKLESFLGHQNTADILGVKMNRENVTFKTGERFVIAQLQGGRLPEFSTELPEGFFFKFLLGQVMFAA